MFLFLLQAFSDVTFGSLLCPPSCAFLPQTHCLSWAMDIITVSICPGGICFHFRFPVRLLEGHGLCIIVTDSSGHLAQYLGHMEASKDVHQQQEVRAVSKEERCIHKTG